MSHPHIIQNAMNVKHESERKIMDGVVRGSLNAFQMSAKKGLLGNAGMPVHKMASGQKASTMKAGGKQPATKLADGYMPYQGSGANRVSKK